MQFHEAQGGEAPQLKGAGQSFVPLEIAIDFSQDIKSTIGIRMNALPTAQQSVSYECILGASLRSLDRLSHASL